jgi:hypothetical protein
MDNIDALAEQGEGGNKTQSQILIELASDFYLFHDEQGTSYAKIKVKDHYEVWPIHSSSMRLIFTGRYLELNSDKAPGSQAMKDTLTALEAKARIYGNRERVHTRVAEYEESIYLDLCNAKWQVVRINKEGWKVINESPVHFKRSKVMQPIPIPTPNGNIEDLKKFINYEKESDFKIIIAWLLSTFKEKSPFPILTFQGVQGSAKSTTSKVLRTLIDPSSLPLRALPREERDLAIAANNTWILAFDNLSGLSNAMSDALCKMSTGGGLATRKLHTDDEEAFFNIMRPCILNGIDDIGRRQDLLDRSIVITLPSINENQRSDEQTFWKEFEVKRESILGALCQIVSSALGALADTSLTRKPRMADFALWVTAAEKALKWQDGEFMAIYDVNRNIAIDQGLEADPVAVAIQLFMEDKTEWTGTTSETLARLGKFVDEKIKKGKLWPTSNKLKQRIRRIAPALKTIGINFVELPRSSRGGMLLLEKQDKQHTQPTQASEYPLTPALIHEGKGVGSIVQTTQGKALYIKDGVSCAGSVGKISISSDDDDEDLVI